MRMRMLTQPSALLKAAPLQRSLHASRKALAEAAAKQVDSTPDATKYTLGTAYRAMNRTNLHVLDAPTVKSWQEIPKHGIYKGDVWKIWYNHAIVPLFFPVIAASALMLGFLYRYFSGNVEIAWSKEMRGTYDHTGLNDHRSEEHTKRLLYRGMMERKEQPVKIFPFNFEPIHSIRDRHLIPTDGDEGPPQVEGRISAFQRFWASFGLAPWAGEDPNAASYIPGKGQY